jgi:hypothetical protein
MSGRNLIVNVNRGALVSMLPPGRNDDDFFSQYNNIIKGVIAGTCALYVAKHETLLSAVSHVAKDLRALRDMVRDEDVYITDEELGLLDSWKWNVIRWI